MDRLVITVGILAALAAGPAWAGGVGVMVSYWDPDEVSDEFGLGVKAELGFGNRVDVELRGSFFREQESEKGPVAFELESFPLELGFAVNLGDNPRVRPYIGGGVGFYFLDSDVGEIDDEAGWYGVLGADFAVREHAAVFIEGLFRQVTAEIEEDDLGLFTDREIDLGGVAANFGVMLSW